MEIRLNVTKEVWQNLLWPVFWFVWAILFLAGMSPVKWSKGDWEDASIIVGIVGGFAAVALLIFFHAVWWSWIGVWIWGMALTTCVRNYRARC